MSSKHERPWLTDLIAAAQRDHAAQVAAGTYDPSRYDMLEAAIPMAVYRSLPADIRSEIADLGAVERGGCACLTVARCRYEGWLARLGARGEGE
jgi:hypothetical protein